jgi:hypothetical protein
MKQVYNPDFIAHKASILEAINNFDNSGVILSPGKRNTIKTFALDGIHLNIKSFKKPNLFNRIVYRYFRPSKAKRSFEFATKLKNNNIGTPKPIAYFENVSIFGLKESFYVCEHLATDLIFKDLLNQDYPDAENILKQFAKFTFDMHQKGIEFLDHSPGNTLINKVENGKYAYFLVDLNRMKFHETMTFDQRMKNLSKILAIEEYVKIVSDEYARLIGKSYDEVFEKLWAYTSAFQRKYWRKKRLKQKINLK